MGAVYLARDSAIGRLVAVKVLRAGVDTPMLRARFSQEARAAGRLKHPNIVTIFHVDEDQGRPYIAMEYVEGLSLGTLIRDRIPLGRSSQLLMLERICDGLAAAHDAGLVHRDIKPANVIVDTRWQPKILDFGLAMLPDSSLSLTDERAVLGTLCYMSPEQLSGGVVDRRSDLFAVAVLAYELLTGERAFVGDTKQVIGQILSGNRSHILPTSPLGDDLRELIDKGMNPHAELRFQSAREMGLAFAAVRERIGADSTAFEATRAPSVSIVDGAVRSEIRFDRFHEPRPISNRWRGAAVTVVGMAGVVVFAVAHTRAPEPALSDSVAAHAREVAGAPGAAPQALMLAPTTRPRVADSRLRPAATPVPEGQTVTPREETDAPSIVDIDTSTALAPPLLAVGTPLSVRVTSTLDSRRSLPGDQFVGVLEEPVTRDGREVVLAGNRIEGRVEQSGLAGGGRPFMELSLTSLAIGARMVPIRTGFYRAVAPNVEHGPSFVAIVIGGAAGAALGGAIAGSKGAVAGTALGAASVAAVRDDAPTEYRFGGRLPFRLAEPVRETP
jgi:hypothetical protein